METLMFKIGARVMLTYNIDTIHLLSNGSQGEIIGIVKNENIVQSIIVEFDDENAGEKRR